MYNNNSNQINTIRYGQIAVRKNFTEGKEIDFIELSNGEYASIRLDNNTNQPFAVIEKE